MLTLNLWGLPWPVGRDVAERVAAIGAALPDLALDVVAFQEAWTAGARTALAEAGRRAGLAHAFPEPSGPGRGGLLLLSRRALGGARFTAYALNGFPERIDQADYWGNKGFAICEVATPGGNVAVATTHLHARYAPRALDPYVGHRTAQVVQLARALRAIRLPLVALGDFNFEEAFEEYAVFAGLAGVDDAARSLDRRQDTVRWAGSGRLPPGTNPRRIDYVFTRGGDEAVLRPAAIERVLDAPVEIGGRRQTPSDHAGLLADLELAPGIATPRPVDPGALALARRLLVEGRSAAEGRRSALRWSAAGGLAVAASFRAPLLRARLSRRHFLRAGLSSTAALAGGGSLLLAEGVRPAELDAFDAMLREVDAFPRGGG